MGSGDAAGMGLGGGLAPHARSWRASFAAARRHSRFVRLLKLFIPIASVVAIVIVTLVGIYDPFRTLGTVIIGPVNLSGTRITMDQPKLTGFRAKDSKPYQVTAETATQDVKRPTIVELAKINGNVQLESGSAQVSADSGVYDTQTEKVVLRSNVRVRTQDGYDARLNSAFVDFKAGGVTSDDGVDVTFNEGSIAAQRLNISDSGHRMTFEGRVKATFKAAAPGAPIDVDQPPPSPGQNP